ncbi:hypothetical protein COT03_02175 [Candidatus Shapirobacteria bacterium CG07_land_8_20_14_0_80_39_18]|uniref:AbiEi antitoxin C-terminal domain-containing protein n=1 Tax=Candidatus Shapirobacteria bacterium CG07_land_8_20_14_0_80_39_18 TaxID=1974882 RepID=A0A2M6YR02_9BACT|nr:MAG: hypothetical protein COT03_02175 [Candidatus Shapirobacteria bacterium CG07_land_8_20_14_0_80_39_18]
MYTLLKPLLIRERLLQKKLFIFTPRDFELTFQLPKQKAKYFLEKESKDGLFLRLKKGLYSLKTNPLSEEELANHLYRPSYISFEYALASYNILPEMTYSVTSATTKPTRTFIVNNKTFSYSTIKKEAYTGYTLIKQDGAVFLMAEPEKALVDYLYFVVLGKKTKNDRLKTSSLQKEKLLKYAYLYNKNKLTKLVRELL